MHRGEGVDDPLRARCVLDGVPQVVQPLVPDVEVGPELGVGKDRLNRLDELRPGLQGEFVLLRVAPFAEDGLFTEGAAHDLVVEKEGRSRIRREPSPTEIPASQHGEVGRFDSERPPVLEADLAQWGDFGDREIAFRRLGLGRAGRFVVILDLVDGGGTKIPACCRDFVAHEAPRRAVTSGWSRALRA